MRTLEGAPVLAYHRSAHGRTPHSVTTDLRRQERLSEVVLDVLGAEVVRNVSEVAVSGLGLFERSSRAELEVLFSDVEAVAVAEVPVLGDRAGLVSELAAAGVAVVSLVASARAGRVQPVPAAELAGV